VKAHCAQNVSSKGAIEMTAQSENKDKVEQKIAKDELTDKEMDKVTGGDKSKSASNTTTPTETMTFNYGSIKYTNT